MGYKYVNEKDSTDQQGPWQELFYRPAPIGDGDWIHHARPVQIKRECHPQGKFGLFA